MTRFHEVAALLNLVASDRRQKHPGQLARLLLPSSLPHEITTPLSI